MQLPVTITLKKPVQHGNKLIDEIVFEREMVAADMFGIRLSGGGIDAKDYALVVGRLTNLPDPVIGKLHIIDFRAVMEVVDGFLFDGPETGPTA